ncbi:Asp-tRNA(Asn)/Glu-tRNA(Gln) amidotransferase subunit GatA [Candidatus Uhrbacteria bacterium]|nr:Asp-tRNA(Asn)/Glu-tRNA(Gln) amidotransferase subunit GatA [Candidatus Uhrbacteria bacterium]
MELHELSLTEAAKGLAAKTFSSREMTEAVLRRAAAKNATTHAYVLLTEDEALRQADEADHRRARQGEQSPLDGVPIAVKDNILVAGVPATAGSNIIKDYVAPYDATVVARLRRAGAVIVGKTNMDEFAMGSSSETSCHGVTRNPWDAEKIPGGSSGGSAAAVAEGSAIAALGSDTGGSIRQPAAMCGVVGLKPTYGRVSRYGLIAMASSLDQIGPITKTVDDAAAMLGAIEGQDPMDSTSLPLAAESKLPEKLPAKIKGLRVGLPKEYFVGGMEPGVEAAIKEAIETLRGLGADIKEISLPHAEYALAVYYVLMPSEVSANLSRFDGIRYGHRVAGASLEETYRKSRGAGFGREVRRRIMLGTYALSAGYYDAYYLKALKVRKLIANDFAQAFTEVDCILTPTSPIPAWNLGEKVDDPLSMYLADIYTVSVNVAGVPAISLPCGFSAGLPVGLQLIGRHFDEKTILSAAKAYEAAADWRAKNPLPTN